MKVKLYTLFLCLTAFTLVVSAQNPSGTCGTNLTWEFDPVSGELAIRGTGTTMNNFNETNIPWLAYQKEITSVSLPSNLTKIGTRAFWQCSNLVSITLPNSLTDIGEMAFWKCSSLASITLPSTLNKIGNHAFRDDSALVAISIPEGVTEIPYCCFHSCTSLTSVSIPSTVNRMGTYVFRDCASLTSVVIPEGVTSLGYTAFMGCRALMHVSLPSTLTTLGDYVFTYCSSLASIDIPSSVTSIGNRVFYGCSSLTSFVFPEGIESVSDYMFFECTSLSSVVIPNSVTSIGDYAFRSCTSLTTIDIPDGVTHIGQNAFRSCEGLTSLVLPSSLETMDELAFYNCNKVKSVIIPEGVTEIKRLAFDYCSGLQNITIPSTVESIEESAFNWCYGLKIINCKANDVPAFTPNSLVSSFKGVIYVPAASVDAYKQAENWSAFASFIQPAPSINLAGVNNGFIGTKYTEKACHFENCDVYTAAWNNDYTILTLSKQTNYLVPANTAVLLFGDNPESVYWYEMSEDVVDTDGNAFQGALEATNTNLSTNSYYVLAKSTSGDAVLKKYVGATIPAGKAYLSIPVASANAPAFFTIEGMDVENGLVTATADIHAIDAKPQPTSNTQIYSIMGIPVSNPSAPGIYVQGDKKLIIR